MLIQPSTSPLKVYRNRRLWKARRWYADLASRILYGVRRMNTTQYIKEDAWLQGRHSEMMNFSLLSFEWFFDAASFSFRSIMRRIAEIRIWIDETEDSRTVNLELLSDHAAKTLVVKSGWAKTLLGKRDRTSLGFHRSSTCGTCFRARCCRRYDRHFWRAGTCSWLASVIIRIMAAILPGSFTA